MLKSNEGKTLFNLETGELVMKEADYNLGSSSHKWTKQDNAK